MYSRLPPPPPPPFHLFIFGAQRMRNASLRVVELSLSLSPPSPRPSHILHYVMIALNHLSRWAGKVSRLARNPRIVPNKGQVLTRWIFVPCQTNVLIPHHNVRLRPFFHAIIECLNESKFGSLVLLSDSLALIQWAFLHKNCPRSLEYWSVDGKMR